MEQDLLAVYLYIRIIWRVINWLDLMGGGVIENQHDLLCLIVRYDLWIIYSFNGFLLFTDIDRDNSANGFRVSNPSIHQCAALSASLEVYIVFQYSKNNFHFIFLLKIFEEVGIEKIRSKSIILTQYLQYLIQSKLQGRIYFSFL